MIGPLEIFLIVVVVAALLGVALRAWRRSRKLRPCPRCGRGVVKGVLTCPHCEFDFRTIGS